MRVASRRLMPMVFSATLLHQNAEHGYASRIPPSAQTMVNQLLPPTMTLAVHAIPLGLVAVVFIYDFLRSIRPSNIVTRPLYKLLRFLVRPFRDFMQLEDMPEHDPAHPVVLQSPNWIKWALFGLGVIVTVGWTALAVLIRVLMGVNNPDPSPGGGQAKLHLLYSMLMAVSWAYVSLRILPGKLNAAPIGNILFYLAQVLSALTFLLDVFLGPSPTISAIVISAAYLILSTIVLYLAGTLPLSPVLPSATVSPADKHIPPLSSYSSPEDATTFWQWVTFSFPSAYYNTSMKRRLEAYDVWSLSPRFLHRNIFNKYLRLTDEREKKAEAKRKAGKGKAKAQSLIAFLLRASSADIILDIVIELYKSIAGFLPPYALKQLLAILSSPNSPRDDDSWASPATRAHFWALLTLIAHLSFAQCDLAQGWCTRRCYERTRGVIFCALHWKALRRRVVGGAGPAPSDDKSNLADDSDTTAKKSDTDKKSKIEEERAADLGKVVNLMQGDAYAVAQRFWELSPLFGAPVRVGVALWFLYDLLGPAAFAGVGVILFAYAINVPLLRWNLYITRESWKARDKRMTGVNELFQSIRFLKLVGWEGGWAQRVLQRREYELAWRVQGNICSAILAFVWTWIPSATALASFVAYTLVSGKPLTVSIAFTALGVFSQLQASMTQLPGHIFAMFYAYVSMQRINSFLVEEEVPDWASSLKRSTEPTIHEQPEKIGYEKATLEWHRVGKKVDSSSSGHGTVEDEENLVIPDEDRHTHLDAGQPFPSSGEPVEIHIAEEEIQALATSSSRTSVRTGSKVPSFKLENLTVSLPPGRLTLVTGITGAGKTAFLVGLLGEMSLLKGAVHLDKSNYRVAYCAQSAWLEHATIRDNIIYASPRGYDEARYDAVVHACALEKDLEILPAGDMTEIGEKGVSLSGGQRARIALARALYSPANTILLDDPLAAVDMHTARHLVQYCFSGPLMRGRTVILVTHHLHLVLPIAEYLVEIDDGKLTRHGSVQQLKKTGQLDDVIPSADDSHANDEEPSSPAAINDADGALLPPSTRNTGGANTPSSSTHVDSAGNEAEDQKGKGTSKPSWRLSTAEHGKLVDEEARAEGRVSLKTYLTYAQAAGYWSWGATVVLIMFMRGIDIVNQFYLSKWGEAYNHNTTVADIFATVWTPVKIDDIQESANDSSFIPILDDLPPPDENVRPWILIYLGISVVGALNVMAFISLGLYASLQASRSLFKRMLIRLSRAPSRFYDITPVGRILNRFVADMGAIDGAVNGSARAAVGGSLQFISSFCVIIYVVPMFTPIAIFIAWLYIRFAPPYVRTSRDLRRLESISLSPAFAGFDELLHGLVHVRAFGVEGRYQERFYQRVDAFQGFDHSYWLVAFWLRWRYDCLGSVVVYVTTIFALSAGVSSGLAAVVILNAGIFAEASRQLVKVLAQVELDFNSVERVGEYLDVQQEAPAIIEKSRPPAYWPSSTNGITVEDLWIRYSSNSPDVLRGLSFQIFPGEKIGVVGRTGSGKTTLCAAFLRIVEPHKGSIKIDGIDISTIGLEDLRTRLTVVSQDVALFEGTVKFNLDPFEEHSDQECWDVLRRCHLVSQDDLPVGTISTATTTMQRRSVFDSLESPIAMGGGSLSAGQRQLVALARAMLRRSQVVLTDEATSAIDLELDDQIQQTIRQELGDATVITIAHRLRTVIEYDRILVLSHGEIVEFDTPARLLRQNGAFAALCRGSADWEHLKRLVKDM